jgi:hypothetical protein
VSHPTINDPALLKHITLAEAYRLLQSFLVQYNARGEGSTAELLGALELLPDGGSADPAQLADFVRCAEQIIGARTQP